MSTKPKEAQKPGYYPSKLKDYPGYIQFPHPFTYRHFQAWWSKAVAPLKGLTKLDWEATNAEWQGAKELVLEFGEWAIQGVAIGDAREDSLPLEVISFVVDCADDYIAPLLAQKKMRWLSIVT